MSNKDFFDFILYILTDGDADAVRALDRALEQIRTSNLRKSTA